VAVRGSGFFEIQMPDGNSAYTRDGSFQVSATGQLVTNNGYTVQPGITIPANAQSVTIGSDGTVSVVLPGQADAADGRQIQIANFVNPAGLEPKGQNIFARPPPRARRTPARRAERPRLAAQGFVETSNVNVVEELVAMIQTQRAYELNSKAIQTSDQMLQRLASCDARMNAARSRRCAVPRRLRTLEPAPAGRRRAADRDAPGKVVRAGHQQRLDLQARSTGRCSKDHRARLVGDTITVQIVEKIGRHEDQHQLDRQERQRGRSVTALPGLRPQIVHNGPHQVGLSSSTPFAGKGSTVTRTTSPGTITATVIEVLPNGHLVTRAKADRREPQRRRAALLRPGRPEGDPVGQLRAVGADRQRAHRAPRPRRPGRSAGNRLGWRASF
jgi:flagellar basal body L-ring protein FlgH